MSRQLFIAAAAAVTAAVMLNRCGSAPQAPTQDTTAVEAPNGTTELQQPLADSKSVGPSAVDSPDPGAVALAAVATVLEWDTRTDTSPADAAVRAARWLSPVLRTELASPTRTYSTWLDLEQHDGYTTAVAHRADEYSQPEDTATTAYVQVSATVTFHGRDGWEYTRPAQLVRVTLQSASGGTWLISELTT